MKTMNAHLHLSTNLTDRTRDRCPDVVFWMNGEKLVTIRTDEEQPRLPFEDGGIAELMLEDDLISRVIDEEAWLQEFARIIKPGGTLRFTLPASGILAWLDTMNAYRYLTDISGRGDSPDAALPTGWNRHYSRDHILRMLDDAGFDAPNIKSQNHALQEIGLLTGLLRDNWIGQDRLAERQLFPRFGRRNPGGRKSLITTTWNIEASKCR